MLDVPSTVGGLAFAPKGFRLAIAHYNGVTLWYPNAQSEPEKLEWKGSHLGARVSPDGKFVVTTMQEPTLHGWRLADRKDMRMSGYGARVRSLGWTAGGKWLATSGSTQLILWPFQGKDGPMGKTPRMLAPAEAQAEVVACHPKQEVVAVGYADGLVLMVRIEDGAEVLARKPGGAPVTRARLERDRRHARLRNRGRRGRRHRSADPDAAEFASAGYFSSARRPSAGRARGCQRVVGQPVPDLAAAEQRNAEIAAHLELLAVGAELHQRAIDRAVARVHDRAVLVGGSVALHALDQRRPSTGAPRSAPSHLSQTQFSSSPGLKKILTMLPS